MTDSTQQFISELIRSANEMDKIGAYERGRLLDRAARTIRDYREQIAFSDAPANDQPDDIASELAAMGRTSEVFTTAEVSAKLLEAVDVIKTLRVLMEGKEAVLRGEA